MLYKNYLEKKEYRNHGIIIKMKKQIFKKVKKKLHSKKIFKKLYQKYKKLACIK